MEKMDLSRWMEPSELDRPGLIVSVNGNDNAEAMQRRLQETKAIGFGEQAFHWQEKSELSDKRFEDAALSWNQEIKQQKLLLDGSAFFERAIKLLQEDDPDCVGMRLKIERCIGVEDAEAQLARTEVVGVYCLSLREGQTINGLEPWSPDITELEREDILVAVSVQLAGPDESFFGVDVLEKDTSLSLIERLGLVLDCIQLNEEGSATEAQLILDFSRNMHNAPGSVVWPKNFAEFYCDRWSEEIQPLLPLLWFDGPGAARFRWRYRSLLAELFRDNFVSPLAEWGKETKRQLTARFLKTASPVGEILNGMGPSLYFGEFVPSFLVTDEDSRTAGHAAVSIARQQIAQKPESVYAIDALAKYALPKAKTDIQTALAQGLGKTFVSSSPISLRGNAKRETGASIISPAQSWWADMERVNACAGRWRDLLSQGARTTGILIFSPMDSVMALSNNPLPSNMTGLVGRRSSVNTRAEEIASTFEHLQQVMDTSQILFDLGDEELISRIGKARANTFFVGDGEYTTVVVPPALSWRSNTIKKLRQFARKGGNIILARPIAPLVDFEESSALEDLAEEFGNVYIVERSGRPVCVMLNRIEPQTIQIRTGVEQNPDCLLTQHRQTDETNVFFVANTSKDRDIVGRVFVAAKGAVRVHDAWTPSIRLISTEEEKTGQVFSFTFPADSATMFIVGGRQDKEEPVYEAMPYVHSQTSLEESWLFERLDPNCAPLSFCRMSVNGGNVSALKPVAFARMDLKEKLEADASFFGAKVSLIFAFESEIESTGRNIRLVLEPDNGMEVFLNGTGVALDTEEYLWDASFRSLDVSALIQKGTNKLEVRFPYDANCVVEDPILAGDFAVRVGEQGQISLTEEPEFLNNGSWTDQGYPFYAGRMRYLQDFNLEMEAEKRYFLRLAKPLASSISIRIGDQDAASVPFQPWRLEVTRLGRKGRNALEVEVCGSLFNLFGPVHFAGKSLSMAASISDVYDKLPYRESRLWTNRPALAPFGLMEGAVLEMHDPSAPIPVKKSVEKEIFSEDPESETRLDTETEEKIPSGNPDETDMTDQSEQSDQSDPSEPLDITPDAHFDDKNEDEE